MVWAVAVLAILAVGVPSAGWLLSRRLERRRPRPVDGLGPPVGQADGWLIERYRLPAWQRYKVRQAVLFGRAVKDPALRNAARELAAAALAGEVTLGRGIRLMGWILLAVAIVVMTAGTFAAAALGGVAGVLPVLLGGWWAVRAVMALRATRGGAERARRLNA